MKPHVNVVIKVGVLRSMTVEQFEALQQNILADGLWETAESVSISGSGEGYIGVEPKQFRPDPDRLERIMFIGIERDGYTHS